MSKQMTLRRLGFLSLVAALVAVAAVGLGLLVDVLRSPNEPAEADKQERLTRKLNIEASVERTYFTGPLRSDGTIDYLAAINHELKEGVTKENNAFVGLAKVLRPKYPFEEDAADIVKKLAIIEEEMKESPAFTTWHETYRYHIKAGAHFGEDETKSRLDDLFEQPFSENALREFRIWVRLNRDALEVCGQALERDRYWVPLFDEPGGNDLLLATSQPHSSLIRELSMCYRAQLILATSEGDADIAANALRALLRLARHHSNAPSLIDGLIAIAVKAQAMFTLQSLLNEGLLTEAMLDQFAAQWKPSDGLVKIVNHIDRWERCISLDGLMQAASGRSSITEILDGDRKQQLFDTLYLDKKFDVNASIGLIQAEFNQLIEVLKNPDYREFSNFYEAYDDDMYMQSDKALSELIFDQNGQSIINNQLPERIHTRALTRFYLGIMMPALGAAHRTELRASASYRNCYVAIGVERYLVDQGELPESLNQLVPDYIEAIPEDPFDQQPLKYRILEHGYSVYSLGDNLKDDGGVHDLEDGDIAIMVERWKPEK